MSMTFLFFYNFFAKSPPNLRDQYPPTLKICDLSLGNGSTSKICNIY